MPTNDMPDLKFGSEGAAREWALRLVDISSNLDDHGFNLAAENVLEAAEWLAAFGTSADIFA